MSNLSTQHLIKCIIQKDKYKQTQQYLKQLCNQNQSVYPFINQGLYSVIVTNNHPPTTKLYGLRFFKDLFLTAQFQLIDGLHQSIFKQIVKACQFDKSNSDKSKRGVQYFQKIQKRKKQSELQKFSYSFVLFCTQIVHVMGKWYAKDQNEQQTEYSVIYDKLKKAGIPFPANDKQLKFFRPQERQTFTENFREWVQKLPQIQQESEDAQENGNFKTRKSIQSKQELPEVGQVRGKLQQVVREKLVIREKSVLKEGQVIKDKLAINEELAIDEQSVNNRVGKTAQTEKQRQEAQLRFANLNKDRQSLIKRLELEKCTALDQTSQLKIRLEEAYNINRQNQAKINQLQSALKKEEETIDTQQKRQVQILKNKYSALQNKYITLQNQHNNLQTKSLNTQRQLLQVRTSSEQNQSKIHKLNSQNLQQKMINRKLQAQIKQLNRKLKQQVQILNFRLEQSSQTIKKLQIILHPPQHPIKQIKYNESRGQKTNQQIKTKDMQLNKQKSDKEIKREIQSVVQSYTKQIVVLEEDINKLKNENQALKNDCEIKRKELVQMKFKSQQKDKQNRTLLTQRNNLLNRQGNNRVNQNQQIVNKRQNSMSEYLQSKSILQRPISQTKTYNFFSSANSSNQQSGYDSTKIPNQTSKYQRNDENPNSKQRVKNNSFGKTQKSSQKLKERQQRLSAGKTHHSPSSQFRKSQQQPQFNSYKTYDNWDHKKVSSSSSYGNLFVMKDKTNYGHVRTQSGRNCFKKANLMLNNRKSWHQQLPEQKQALAQTIIPYIDSYFGINNSGNTANDSFVFKSLCLFEENRRSQAVFADRLIQVRLLQNPGSKQMFTLQVTNMSCNSTIKVKAVSCHDEFQIPGQKTRHINSNSNAQYHIQTRTKDMNLRFPVISLIVTQQVFKKNVISNLTYNIPLPLTLLQFTQFESRVTQAWENNCGRVRSFKSERFSLNRRMGSLDDCFPKLGFYSKFNALSGSKGNLVSWEGILKHRFIQNVETYFRMVQVQAQIQLEFLFREHDQVSQNYSKVMIQTLMFLLI